MLVSPAMKPSDRQTNTWLSALIGAESAVTVEPKLVLLPAVRLKISSFGDVPMVSSAK